MSREGLVIVRESLPMLMNRVRARTPAARGHVYGAQDRLRRDAVGEKLQRLWKQSVLLKRETGKESGPFQVKDWMR